MENTVEPQSSDKGTKRLKVAIEVEFDIPFDWNVGPDDPDNPCVDCLHVEDRAYIPVLTWMKLSPKNRSSSSWVEIPSDEEEFLNARETFENTRITVAI